MGAQRVGSWRNHSPGHRDRPRLRWGIHERNEGGTCVRVHLHPRRKRGQARPAYSDNAGEPPRAVCRRFVHRGIRGGRPESRFRPRLAALAGWTDYKIDAVGLTGFMRPGANPVAQRTYLDRIKLLHDTSAYNPNVIIFQGGLNDNDYAGRQLQRAVQDTLAQAKVFWPDASLILIGPITFRDTLAPVTESYKNGAYVAKIPFIDLNRRPVIKEADNARLTIQDGWHPNSEGHALIAAEVRSRIDAVTA
ncbi:SGNH/GDSL hydrolase family protein [Rhodococcus cerastii]|uniref:SGNH/GDSL hydrolase family protein n=1 Tax=Rhodococcus cerastii TaxID=908616 RepID=A0ABU4D404_9NOCA|nr:SGNH/GDSL hydrolase family protein [Rhodococcus cerastii]MDV6304449.1 SGNH/GDSL hydrolase family protein [Rhodococcus cerastii]